MDGYQSKSETTVLNMEETQSLVPTIQQKIDNSDIKDHQIVLLDISGNKEWIAYVSIHGSKKIVENDIEPRVFITRRRFTEVIDTPMEYNDEENNHCSYDITEILQGIGIDHCKFLSVSADGKYIALSFFSVNNDRKPSRNTINNYNCYIYAVGKDGIQCDHTIKFTGHAKFLNHNGNCTLALMNQDYLQVYEKYYFKKCTHWFDLRPLISSSKPHPNHVINQTSFIKNTAWASLNGSDTGGIMKRLITYSRHIRNNVLATPFTGGIIRVWSIVDDGIRLASFKTNLNEHIMAFSNDNKFIATFVEDGMRSINIYEIKSGLLVYTLISQGSRKPGVKLEVSHLRFCFDDHYLAMASTEREIIPSAKNLEREDRPEKLKLKDANKVVFEVWYIKTQTSIYIKEKDINTGNINENKVVQPFIFKGKKDHNKIKCLYGIYTTIENERAITKRLELDIDELVSSNGIVLKWKVSVPYFQGQTEIESNLNQTENLKCGEFTTKNGSRYLIRFGKYMVQLWRLNNPDISEQNYICDKDQLIYIRAYKAPTYGVNCSFRDAWMVNKNFEIKFIGGFPLGRMILNITSDDESPREQGYYTEELFLPFDQLLKTTDALPRYDYHQLESACQALHYLSVIIDEPVYHLEYPKEQYMNNRDMLYRKTEEIILKAIENIGIASKYFTTITGSKTLAMLASFEKGRDIIKIILLGNSIPVRVFSYPRTYKEMINYSVKYDDEYLDIQNVGISYPNERTLSLTSLALSSFRSSPSTLNTQNSVKKLGLSQSVAPNENVFTVLALGSKNHTLFKLLFNIVLTDSKNLGPGCLSTITDTIFFLQSMQQAKDDSYYSLMFNCIKKLSFLNINKDALAILRNEFDKYQYKKTLTLGYSSSLIYLNSFSAMEQITRYNTNSPIDQVYYWVTEAYKSLYENFLYGSDNSRIRKRERIIKKLFKTSEKWRTYQNEEYTEGLDGLSQLCIVPLIGFNSYENQHKKVESSRSNNSVFEKLVSDKYNSSIFQEGGNVIDILLESKWEKFARTKFIIMFSIHLVFYITYILSMSFAGYVYDYEPGNPFTNYQQIGCVAVMFISITLIFIQNFRRLLNSQRKTSYFSSFFNYFDIFTVVILPVISLLCIRYDWPNRKEGISICVLLMWVHAILKLRVFPFIGVTLETIIQLWRSVAPVFCFMAILICAFTNSFMTLLYEEETEYFQEKYNGNITASPLPTDEELISNTGMTMQDISSDNPFKNVFKAFYTVWFLMFGVWDPLNDGDTGDNVMIMLLSMLFTFFTVFIFFNLTIARMSGAVERVSKQGDKIWITHFAAILSEIESVWCMKRERRNRTNNPELIFYNANARLISRQRLMLERETEKLQDALKNDREFIEEFDDILF